MVEKIRVGGRVTRKPETRAEKQRVQKQAEQTQQRKIKEARKKRAKKIEDKLRDQNFGGSVENFKKQLNRVPKETRKFINISVEDVQQKQQESVKPLKERLERAEELSSTQSQKWSRKGYQAQAEFLRDQLNKIEDIILTPKQRKDIRDKSRDIKRQVSDRVENRTKLAEFQKTQPKTITAEVKGVGDTSQSGTFVKKTVEQGGNVKTTFSNPRTEEVFEFDGEKEFRDLSKQSQRKLERRTAKDIISGAQNSNRQFTTKELKNLGYDNKEIDVIKGKNDIETLDNKKEERLEQIKRFRQREKLVSQLPKEKVSAKIERVVNLKDSNNKIAIPQGRFEKKQEVSFTDLVSQSGNIARQYESEARGKELNDANLEKAFAYGLVSGAKETVEIFTKPGETIEGVVTLVTSPVVTSKKIYRDFQRSPVTFVGEILGGYGVGSVAAKLVGKAAKGAKKLEDKDKKELENLDEQIKQLENKKQKTRNEIDLQQRLKQERKAITEELTSLDKIISTADKKSFTKKDAKEVDKSANNIKKQQSAKKKANTSQKSIKNKIKKNTLKLKDETIAKNLGEFFDNKPRTQTTKGTQNVKIQSTTDRLRDLFYADGQKFSKMKKDLERRGYNVRTEQTGDKTINLFSGKKVNDVRVIVEEKKPAKKQLTKKEKQQQKKQKPKFVDLTPKEKSQKQKEFEDGVNTALVEGDLRKLTKQQEKIEETKKQVNIPKSQSFLNKKGQANLFKTYKKQTERSKQKKNNIEKKAKDLNQKTQKFLDRSKDFRQRTAKKQKPLTKTELEQRRKLLDQQRKLKKQSKQVSQDIKKYKSDVAKLGKIARVLSSITPAFSKDISQAVSNLRDSPNVFENVNKLENKIDEPNLKPPGKPGTPGKKPSGKTSTIKPSKKPGKPTLKPKKPIKPGQRKTPPKPPIRLPKKERDKLKPNERFTFTIEIPRKGKKSVKSKKNLTRNKAIQTAIKSIETDPKFKGVNQFKIELAGKTTSKDIDSRKLKDFQPQKTSNPREIKFVKNKK